MGARGERSVGEGDAVPRVLPALVHEPVLVEARVLDEPVAVAVAVAHDPLERAIGRARAGRRRRRGGRPSGRARRGRRRTAASRRPCRSRPSRRRARGWSWRRAAPRGGCVPAAPRTRHRLVVPCRSASVRSVPSASVGSTGSAISAVSSESRPNRAMNQGTPAATTGAVGVRRVEDAQRSEVELALQDHPFDRVVLDRGDRDARTARRGTAAPGPEGVGGVGVGSDRVLVLLTVVGRRAGCWRPGAARLEDRRRTRGGRPPNAAPGAVTTSPSVLVTRRIDADRARRLLAGALRAPGARGPPSPRRCPRSRTPARARPAAPSAPASSCATVISSRRPPLTRRSRSTMSGRVGATRACGRPVRPNDRAVRPRGRRRQRFDGVAVDEQRPPRDESACRGRRLRAAAPARCRRSRRRRRTTSPRRS